MIGINDTFYTITPSNITLIKCKLGTTAMDYLWDSIEQAKVNPRSLKDTLAGNIEESIILDDKGDYFFNNHLHYAAHTYIEQNQHKPSIQSAKIKKLRLESFWVNFQKKHDFNPVHHHSGFLSFVIWMKIPTRHEEQYRLPICANSNNPSASNFEFLYTNILGDIERMDIKMDPEDEGNMFIFPSSLMHQVYPFYNTDEDRISISGNIVIDEN